LLASLFYIKNKFSGYGENLPVHCPPFKPLHGEREGGFDNPEQWLKDK